MATIDKINVNGVTNDIKDSGAVRFDGAQTLTDAQKTTARGNIAAASAGEVQTIENEIGSTALPTTAQTITGAIAEHEDDIAALGNEGNVRYDEAQSLTDAQKQQARDNIGAASEGQVDAKADKTTTVNGHPLSANVTVTKGDVGLGNVDNTSDMSKPVSIAQQAALDNKADVIIDTASGAIASFPDGMAAPAKNITIDIEPVQDLHGYENPWPGGCGKNLLKPALSSTTIDGVTFTVKDDGTVVANGTASATVQFIGSNSLKTTLVAGTSYILNGCPSGGGGSTYSVRLLKVDAAGTWYGDDNGSTPLTFTVESGKENVVVDIIIRSGYVCNNLTFKPMIRLASESDATFAPYSNICPISGWTGANVVVSPTTDAQDGTTYPISWQSEAGTVYGGTLDVTTGLLTVTMAEVDLGTLTWDSFNGKFLSNSLTNIIKILTAGSAPNYVCSNYKSLTVDWNTASDRQTADKVIFCQPTNNNTLFCLDSAYTDAATFKAAMSGVQLVYELATPITYQLPPQQVALLKGENTVFADCGDTSVTYRADTKLYIQKINAPTDDDMTADAQIASGKYFIIGGSLYKATTIIPAGDAITPGTNCILTNLAEALNALNA